MTGHGGSSTIDIDADAGATGQRFFALDPLGVADVALRAHASALHTHRIPFIRLIERYATLTMRQHGC